MSTILQKTGKQSLRVSEWAISNSYDVGSIVVHNNSIWKANAIIPSGTPFSIGLSGRTWRKMVGGWSSPPDIQIPFEGSIWSRIHTYGNQIFVAGSAFSSRIGGISFTSGNNPASSVELHMDGKPPQSWVKIGATVGNFYGLGSDGCLYVAGSNNRGQLGIGAATGEIRNLITKNTHPALFGPGIRVLDFWHTVEDFDPDSISTSAFATVNDNGTLKTYAWGFNTSGQLGIANTTSQTSPVEVAALQGRLPVKASIITNTAMFVTSDGELFGTGYNVYGQLGVGNATSPLTVMTRSRVSTTAFVTGAIDVKIAYRSGTGVTAYVLLSDGRVLSCGTGNDGALGDGLTNAHQRVFFEPILTFPGSVPLTGITKITAQYAGMIALNNLGHVYVVGQNWDGEWGNGEGRVNAPWAKVIQTDIKDIWFTYSSRGKTCAFYLKNDGYTYAAGYNADNNLGTNTDINDIVRDLTRVLLPEGEYPVHLVKGGSPNVNGVTFNAHYCLTNKNRIYLWGKGGSDMYPYSSEGSLSSAVPLLISDFYTVNNQ
jgi:alpha-tubulin suppressor-like RCC1 family protein